MWGISSKFSVQVAGASLFPLELEIWFTLGSAQGWMLLMATSPCVKCLPWWVVSGHGQGCPVVSHTKPAMERP